MTNGGLVRPLKAVAYLYQVLFFRCVVHPTTRIPTATTTTAPTPKIYAGWATLAVVLWSCGRPTGGANTSKGVCRAPLRPSQNRIVPQYHSRSARLNSNRQFQQQNNFASSINYGRGRCIARATAPSHATRTGDITAIATASGVAYTSTRLVSA